jgi:hypothetical protein
LGRLLLAAFVGVFLDTALSLAAAVVSSSPRHNCPLTSST